MFCQIRQPEQNYLMILETSTSSRMYIPIGYIDKNIIAGNSTLVVSGLSLYHFGVLTSRIHMAWMTVIAGRMGV